MAERSFAAIIEGTRITPDAKRTTARRRVAELALDYDFATSPASKLLRRLSEDNIPFSGEFSIFYSDGADNTLEVKVKKVPLADQIISRFESDAGSFELFVQGTRLLVLKTTQEEENRRDQLTPFLKGLNRKATFYRERDSAIFNIFEIPVESVNLASITAQTIDGIETKVGETRETIASHTALNLIQLHQLGYSAGDRPITNFLVTPAALTTSCVHFLNLGRVVASADLMTDVNRLETYFTETSGAYLGTFFKDVYRLFKSVPLLRRDPDDPFIPALIYLEDEVFYPQTPTSNYNQTTIVNEAAQLCELINQRGVNGFADQILKHLNPENDPHTPEDFEVMYSSLAKITMTLQLLKENNQADTVRAIKRYIVEKNKSQKLLARFEAIESQLAYLQQKGASKQ